LLEGLIWYVYVLFKTWNCSWDIAWMMCYEYIPSGIYAFVTVHSHSHSHSNQT
jgi:hypothetical protein